MRGACHRAALRADRWANDLILRRPQRGRLEGWATGHMVRDARLRGLLTMRAAASGFRVRLSANLLKRINVIPPVQSPSQKYFASPVGQIISTNSRHPTPPEGRIMIVTDAGRDAVDAAAF